MNDNNDNVNSKRPVSDLDPEDLEESQSSKRVADPNTMPKNEGNQTPNKNQPAINQVFIPINNSLIKPSTLNYRDNPMDTSQTTTSGNHVRIEDDENDQRQKNSNNQHSNNLSHQYTIPSNNAFDPISNVNNNVNNTLHIPKLQAKQKVMKIPPITVVGATNFTQAINMLNNQAHITDYTIKYMSIGTKIMLKSSEDYNKLKELLSTANVEFFTHDLNTEKFDKFILSGIVRTSTEEIMYSLQSYQFEPIEVREIDQKNRRFNEEGVYIVSFKHNSAKINNLNKIKINYTVPK